MALTQNSITVDVNVDGINHALEKANQLGATLLKAKSLIDSLNKNGVTVASVENANCKWNTVKIHRNQMGGFSVLVNNQEIAAVSSINLEIDAETFIPKLTIACYCEEIDTIKIDNAQVELLNVIQPSAPRTVLPS